MKDAGAFGGLFLTVTDASALQVSPWRGNYNGRDQLEGDAARRRGSREAEGPGVREGRFRLQPRRLHPCPHHRESVSKAVLRSARCSSNGSKSSRGAAVPRRARISGTQTFVSLNSRLESNKKNEGIEPKREDGVLLCWALSKAKGLEGRCGARDTPSPHAAWKVSLASSGVPRSQGTAPPSMATTGP